MIHKGGRSHHVCVAPVLADCRLGRDDTIECFHVSGLFTRRAASLPVWDPRAVVKTSKRARSSPCDPDFPNPDLVERFHTSFSFSRIFKAVLLTSSVCHQRSPRNSLSFVIIAHHMRAILFANAMAPSIRGLRASIRPSQEFSAGGLIFAPEITAMAPMISNLQISRCPDLLVRPSRCLPPLECCRGTRPNQAEKSRPLPATSPNSAICPRKVLIVCVRCPTRRSRSRKIIPRPCCSAVFT